MNVKNKLIIYTKNLNNIVDNLSKNDKDEIFNKIESDLKNEKLMDKMNICYYLSCVESHYNILKENDVDDVYCLNKSIYLTKNKINADIL